MALSTVQNYVDAARVLLQDTVDAPYRYSNSILVEALNHGILEMRRIRPDLLLDYLRTSAPSYSAASLSTEVAMDEQYRVALVYYMVGHAQIIDDESQNDSRATVFMQRFLGMLTTLKV